MKPQVWRYLVAGLGFYLVFLLLFAPAQWVAWGVTRFSQGQIHLNQPDGSLWRGRGELVWSRPHTTPVALGNASWGVNPLWLVTGRVGATLEVIGPDFQVQARARIAPRSLSIHQGRGVFPAAMIGTLYPPVALLAFAGTVRFHVPEWYIGADGLHGKGEVWWENVGTGLSTINPLGDYHALLQGRDQAAVLQLDTVRGDLQLNGTGEWRPDTGQFTFQGLAKPIQRAGELEPLLRLMGPDQGNGQRALAVRYELPLKRR